MNHREIDAIERLPDDTGLKYPFYSWVHGMAYGVYVFKRHEIVKYIKNHPDHKCIWLEPIPEVTEEECPNCKETKEECACIRNKCCKCGKPVGNITFTVCDDCWDQQKPSEAEKEIEKLFDELLTAFNDQQHLVLTTHDTEKIREAGKKVRSCKKAIINLMEDKR